MHEVVIILALSPFVFPALAQEFAFPTGLATTYDGSVLYFSNSTGKVINSKIYRWTEDAGLTVFAQQPGYHYMARSLLTRERFSITPSLIARQGRDRALTTVRWARRAS